MEEIEEAKEKFLTLVREIDPEVKCVIPERPTNFTFLISFGKGNSKKYVGFPEDDLLDYLEGAREEEIRQRVTQIISEL
ncbi:MAG: hypothetical protein HY590_03905 [Candidatus Omnitrophica bacterium]|nr:hypothetical protein [Candidatus Omnitrophota bacterium]